MRSKHTILVIDDEPDVVKSVQDLLRLDYNVLGTTRATEGLEMLSSQDVHVVMTDQRMPEMTGVQLLHKIRGDHPEAVRLLFTGYADLKAVIDAINEGNVYRYITKPWDPDELQTIIREACERYDLIVERKRLLADVQSKNDELEKSNTSLKEANELKYAFIQVASHELRTPLTILLGLTHLAVKSPNIGEPLNDWLTRIHNAGQRLQHLVEQIVTMLSTQQFQQKLDVEDQDVAVLLKQAVADISPFIELRKQKFIQDWPADLGHMKLDQEKVRDSLNHLLLNAIKFTPDGGSISLKANRDGSSLVIQVSDTGVGIDPSCIPKLFQPFFTGFDITHHASGSFEFGRKGLGLGLSVVKNFVEMHGGKIDVQTARGQGTTFIITLPGDKS